ncbi:LysR family transcriptional regulator [Klebsiella pneumoniae]|nr:LysR family transcriptional regulator [Klebsiella pneumoniae]
MTLVHTLAVAEYLNFRHAANALGVAQSSVSARVKALEEDLGILLFERHARGVRLTEAGRHFVERIAVGIDQLDHAVKTAGMAAAGESGRLRIGIHALIPHSFLAKLIGQYRKDYPDVEVEIAEGPAREAVVQLRAGRLDVAFVAGTPQPPDCHSRRTWTEPLLAVLPERHPLAKRSAVTWPDLAGETFLAYRKFNRPFWRVWRDGKRPRNRRFGQGSGWIRGSCVGFRHPRGHAAAQCVAISHRIPAWGRAQPQRIVAASGRILLSLPVEWPAPRHAAGTGGARAAEPVVRLLQRAVLLEVGEDGADGGGFPRCWRRSVPRPPRSERRW